jgi:hypothetical protein
MSIARRAVLCTLLNLNYIQIERLIFDWIKLEMEKWNEAIDLLSQEDFSQTKSQYQGIQVHTC